MYSFGSRSKERLATCHQDIQFVMNEAIRMIDFTVLCGHRTKEEQDKAYKAGRSKLQFPQSKHNKTPSLAIDVAPWPIDWHRKGRFYYMAGIIMGIARGMGIKMRFGGDWSMDGDITDQTFNDLPHFELYGDKYDNPLK